MSLRPQPVILPKPSLSCVSWATDGQLPSPTFWVPQSRAEPASRVPWGPGDAGGAGLCHGAPDASRTPLLSSSLWVYKGADVNVCTWEALDRAT